MIIIYTYINDSSIYGIYDKSTDTLYLSENPEAITGIIYIR